MAPSLLQKLSRHIQELNSCSLDTALLAKARLCLLDFLASALAGSNSASASSAAKAISTWGTGPCTLLGRNQCASPPAACLYNGIAGHAEELDDSQSNVSGLHLGAAVIPATFALAEEQESSGKDLLTAIICGYEAAGRICKCMDRGHRKRGFHATGTVGVFGADCACAILLKLDEAQLTNALGIAASSAGGLFAFLEDGASVKHFHPGRAAMDGLACALLAANGMTGPANALETRDGFFHAYSEECYSAQLLAGGEPEIFQAYHKLHSACGHAFPAIDAALLLRAYLGEAGKSIGDIGQIHYEGYFNSALPDNPAPLTVQQCRFSIPWLVALALLAGEVSRKSIKAWLGNPEALALASRVSVLENAELTRNFPVKRAGILEAVFRDGATIAFTVDAPRGIPANPVGYDEIAAKFLQETADVLSPEQAHRILNVVDGLDEKLISELSLALRTCGKQHV